MLKKLRNYFVICTMALFGVMTLTACGDDEDEKDLDDVIESVVGNKSIEGKWMAVSAKGWEKYDGEIETFDKTYKPNEMVWEFKSNGVVIIPFEEEEDEEIDAYWKVLGDDRLIITLYDRVEGYECETMSCKFKLSGNELTLIFQERDESYESYGETKFTRIK